MIVPETRVELRSDIAFRKVDDIYLIITLDNQLHKIESPSGVFILDLLSKATLTPLEIREKIEEHFDVSRDPEGAWQSILNFLEEMCQKRIIRCTPDSGREQ